jgi:hypothetical protein
VRRDYNASAARKTGGYGREAASAGGRNTYVPYEVYTSTEFEGFDASLTPIEKSLKKRVRPWNELLKFPSVLEQAAILAEHVRWNYSTTVEGKRERGVPCVHLLEQAWGKEFPEYVDAIPESIRDEYTAKKRFAFPKQGQAASEAAASESEGLPRKSAGFRSQGTPAARTAVVDAAFMTTIEASKQTDKNATRRHDNDEDDSAESNASASAVNVDAPVKAKRRLQVPKKS